jgi:hypothetical protein
VRILRHLSRSGVVLDADECGSMLRGRKPPPDGFSLAAIQLLAVPVGIERPESSEVITYLVRAVRL